MSEQIERDSNEISLVFHTHQHSDLITVTKEIEVTAWVRVDMTIEVDMADGDYDLENLVTENLYVDANSSEINVSGYDVERVEEGAY